MLLLENGQSRTHKGGLGHGVRDQVGLTRPAWTIPLALRGGINEVSSAGPVALAPSLDFLCAPLFFVCCVCIVYVCVVCVAYVVYVASFQSISWKFDF